MRRSPIHVVLLATLMGCVVAGSGATAPGATSGSVVGATVLSATNIDASGCPTTTAGITDFGNVLGGSKTVTAADCTVVFGSSNDTSRLRIAQRDGWGDAMWTMLGTLDTSYGGGDGISDVILDNDLKMQDHIVGADGSTYVIGYDAYSGVPGASIWKFDANGAIDTSYGGGDGQAVVVGAMREAWDGVMLQDGSILVAGGTGSPADALIVKFTSAGALDTTWGGGDGLSDPVTDRATCWDTWAPCRLHVLPDGKLLFASSQNVGGVRALLALRFTANGSIDTTYGGGDGIAPTIGPTLGATFPSITGAAFLPDGSVIVVGYATVAAQDQIIAGKYTPNGDLDTSWGGSGTGMRTLDPAPGTSMNSGPALALADGGIVIFASSESPDDTWAIKLDALGIPVGGFGTAGTYEFPGDAFTIMADIEELPDGRIVAMGTNWSAGGGWIDWSIWVLNSDGSLDATYHGDGRSTSVDPDPGGPGSDSRAAAGSIEPDGSVYMSGDSWAGGYVAVAKYDSVGVANYSSGVADWDTVAPNAATFGACLKSVATGAIGTWATTGACTAVDTDPWNAIPTTTAGAGASIATAPNADADAAVNLRFGFRAAADQAAGRYIAPLTFEVVAPS